jgi:hypothetical protein
VYLNQSVSPLYKLQSPEMMKKREEEIAKINAEKPSQTA